MKILFSPNDRSEITTIKKKLFDAGIECQVRNNQLAQGVFGIPPSRELWIEKADDILKALRLVGAEKLRQMTIIFPGS